MLLGGIKDQILLSLLFDRQTKAHGRRACENLLPPTGVRASFACEDIYLTRE